MADSQSAGSATFAQVIERAWSDAAFKTRLLADPKAALAAAGVSVPPEVTVKVVENTDTMIHLVLPPKPPGAELSEDALEKVTAGLACGRIVL